MFCNFVFFCSVRRQKDDMQVNVAGIRRNIKNLAHNYSDPQVTWRCFFSGVFDFSCALIAIIMIIVTIRLSG